MILTLMLFCIGFLVITPPLVLSTQKGGMGPVAETINTTFIVLGAAILVTAAIRMNM